MSPYLIAGPAVALIGIVAVFFVMRHKSVQTRSMYSARRSQFERKVKAARQRTLAPHGRGEKAPTDQEIAGGETGLSSAKPFQAAGYQAPPASPFSTSSWDVPAAPAPMASPPGPPPAPPQSPAYSPAPPETAYPPAPPYTPAEPSSPTPAEPVWTPVPSQPAWTPSPGSDTAPTSSTIQPAEPVAPMAAGGGGASWSIVGDAKEAEAPTDKDKGRRKGKKGATGADWEVGPTPGEEDAEESRKPNAAMAIAQYAVLVVGLVMVLIGVVIMVANSKVT